MSRQRLLGDGEAGEIVILAMPTGLLIGIGVRSGDWILAGAIVGLVLVFGLLVLGVWLGSRVEVVQPRPEPRAIEAPKLVPPLAAGVFVVDVPATDGGGQR